jgi:hypothetical protein
MQAVARQFVDIAEVAAVNVRCPFRVLVLRLWCRYISVGMTAQSSTLRQCRKFLRRHISPKYSKFLSTLSLTTLTLWKVLFMILKNMMLEVGGSVWPRHTTVPLTADTATSVDVGVRDKYWPALTSYLLRVLSTWALQDGQLHGIIGPLALHFRTLIRALYIPSKIILCHQISYLSNSWVLWRSG